MKKTLVVSIDENLYDQLEEFVRSRPGTKLSTLVNDWLSKTFKIYLDMLNKKQEGKKD